MIPRVGKGLMVQIRGSWQTMFKRKYLLLTNTLIGGGLMAMGDCLLQNWEIQTKPDRVYDWMRTGRMLVSGLVMGPPMHYWYAWIDKRFVGTTLSTVGKKVLLDQIISSPAMMFGYFVGMEVMEGHSLYDGLEEFKGKFWELYRASTPPRI
ncbi:mpv17-like protein 2 [Tautogolabrus adspersus]